MRSSQWNRYGKAPAQLTLNQKIFNVLMAFVLVFTLIPVTSLTYTDEANAEPTVQQLSDEAAGNEGSSNDSSSQNGNSGQGNTGTSEGSQNGADSSEVQEGGRIILIQPILDRTASLPSRVIVIRTLTKQITIREATMALLIPPLLVMKETNLALQLLPKQKDPMRLMNSNVILWHGSPTWMPAKLARN